MTKGKKGNYIKHFIPASPQKIERYCDSQKREERGLYKINLNYWTYRSRKKIDGHLEMSYFDKVGLILKNKTSVSPRENYYYNGYYYYIILPESSVAKVESIKINK